nr:unnamed protein product [Callosobruchus chinensis]
MANFKTSAAISISLLQLFKKSNFRESEFLKSGIVYLLTKLVFPGMPLSIFITITYGRKIIHTPS